MSQQNSEKGIASGMLPSGNDAPAPENQMPAPKSELDYEIFFLVFTIFALIVASAIIFLSLASATEIILLQINFLISIVLLIDFFHLYRRAENKITYLKTQGWLDFLSSLPFYPILRFLRIFRLVVVWRELRKRGAHPIWNEIEARRSQNALRYVALVVLLVITLGSILVLQFESPSPDANILTGQESIWWAIVTIATVGYGDYYPVTLNGRLVGVVLMIVGVGMFGVLSSYLARYFLSPTRQESANLDKRNKESLVAAIREAVDPLKEEIAALRIEVAQVKQKLSDEQSGRVLPGEDQENAGNS